MANIVTMPDGRQIDLDTLPGGPNGDLANQIKAKLYQHQIDQQHTTGPTFQVPDNSGGIPLPVLADPQVFRPQPMPDVPFMPHAQVGPQTYYSYKPQWMTQLPPLNIPQPGQPGQPGMPQPGQPGGVPQPGMQPGTNPNLPGPGNLGGIIVPPPNGPGGLPGGVVPIQPPSQLPVLQPQPPVLRGGTPQPVPTAPVSSTGGLWDRVRLAMRQAAPQLMQSQLQQMQPQPMMNLGMPY